MYVRRKVANALRLLRPGGRLCVANALRLLRPGGHLCVCDFTLLPEKGQDVRC
ncbi:hypothetical protein T484DRAFT_1859299 [Baffinella frigidus]|nr:hypothetical protein T484DRAFT_1859299 [Cryptophyta sp. CCMP2293]